MSVSADITLGILPSSQGQPPLPDPLVWLTRKEQERYATYRVEAARHQFLAARVLLKTMVGDICGTSAPNVLIQTDDNGRPFLMDLPGQISISHCPEYIAVAYAERLAVGIDVERQSDATLITDIAAQIMTPAEQNTLQETTDPLAYFQRVWTAKEAALKCAGTGFLTDPKRFATDIYPDHAMVQGILTTGEVGAYHVRHRDLEGGAMLAVAVEEKRRASARVTVRHYHWLNVADGGQMVAVANEDQF
ncbi:4'-phosphopantetheinyl transferase family protein [Parvularcula sp. LCG005]|uniref:4'-phosphopantetheinyl transferase family protein n=1 Tax=Parvularcula sp. LCG005 TaxID=3078805 RepID=UPI002941C42D|nr:4'-phosphopantetheinyl transferase superfamily protein [Parvularcula sp. LCG005]WOI54554.1 4'-phosphopantetheinyl transferase superfamily protein [Parvularcula sp. LCG005]